MSDTKATSAPELEREARFQQYEREEAIARATDCGIAKCDGHLHSADTPQGEWWHRVGHHWFDGKTVEIELVQRPNEPPQGFIWLERTAEMSSAELRAMADVFESYPGWLRVHADRLDSLRDVTK